jgi:hypothetical protein
MGLCVKVLKEHRKLKLGISTQGVLKGLSTQQLIINRY